jgi:hypothetical protein
MEFVDNHFQATVLIIWRATPSHERLLCFRVKSFQQTIFELQLFAFFSMDSMHFSSASSIPSGKTVSLNGVSQNSECPEVVRLQTIFTFDECEIVFLTECRLSNQILQYQLDQVEWQYHEMAQLEV